MDDGRAASDCPPRVRSSNLMHPISSCTTIIRTMYLWLALGRFYAACRKVMLRIHGAITYG